MRFLADLGGRYIYGAAQSRPDHRRGQLAAVFIATYPIGQARAMQLPLQQSGTRFHPIGDEFVSATAVRTHRAGRSNDRQIRMSGPVAQARPD